MKRIILFLCFILSVGMSYAQFDASRITVGGGLGLQFGDYTLVNLSPQVGYNITSYLNAGAGFNYTHYNRKYNNKTMKLSSDYLGFNVYATLSPIPYLVFKVQPEINRMWRADEIIGSGNKVKTEEFMFVCLVGGGVRFGPVTAMIQYDVAQNEYSPYGDKIFYSVGYTFNF